ncbi:MAG: sialidase family protein, partial [Prevotella sp.]
MKTYHFLLVLMLVISGRSLLHTQQKQVPGVVINHIAQSGGKYIGSPSLCVLPDGTYLASHDEFGVMSDEGRAAITRVFASHDRGASWQCVSTLQGQFWSTLFCMDGKAYLIGTIKAHGDIVIRCSTDGGHTWTEP